MSFEGSSESESESESQEMIPSSEQFCTWQEKPWVRNVSQHLEWWKKMCHSGGFTLYQFPKKQCHQIEIMHYS
jgi:hypothetical protein